MNANELMIGDLLDLSNVPNDIIPCKVVELHADELYVIQPNDTACDVVGYDMIKPIPITAEILKKNGWVLCDDCEYVSPFDIDFKTCLRLFGFGEYYNERGFGVNVGFVQLRKGLKYVHELQNLLSSLGMSEVADNFKVE